MVSKQAGILTRRSRLTQADVLKADFGLPGRPLTQRQTTGVRTRRGCAPCPKALISCGILPSLALSEGRTREPVSSRARRSLDFRITEAPQRRQASLKQPAARRAARHGRDFRRTTRFGPSLPDSVLIANRLMTYEVERTGVFPGGFRRHHLAIKRLAACIRVARARPDFKRSPRRQSGLIASPAAGRVSIADTLLSHLWFPRSALAPACALVIERSGPAEKSAPGIAGRPL